MVESQTPLLLDSLLSLKLTINFIILLLSRVVYWDNSDCQEVEYLVEYQKGKFPRSAAQITWGINRKSDYAYWGLV